MTGQEKILYHQIHPLKLFTDWSTGLISFYLLWRRRPRAALVTQFVPAILVSSALIRWGNLAPQQHSAAGRYVAKHMTPAMQTLRLIGNVIMSVGAWRRRPELMFLGLLTILFGWLRGSLVNDEGQQRGSPSAGWLPGAVRPR